jgi:fused signal recognition particle receptor
VSIPILLAHLFKFPFPGLAVAALISQIPLIGLAAVLEWNQRKKRPGARRGTPASRLGAEPRVDRAARPATSSVEIPERVAAARSPAHHPPTDAPTPSESFEASAAEPARTRPASPAVSTGEQAPQSLEADTLLAGPSEHREAVQPQSGATEQAEREAPKETPIEPPRRQPIPIGVGLRKTRESFLARIRAAITGSAHLDQIYEGLEEALIGADVGVETSVKLVEAVRSTLKNDARADIIRNTLKEQIAQLLRSVETPLQDSTPLVIMLAGVNGVGKTTTVAKLAALLKSQRGSVIVAASDTFRAAAIEQLQIWCDRAGVELIKQKPGSDPAAVAFDAARAANARKASAVLIDTAGRLQTKVNLMEELKKIARVVSREIPGAPHENWLVLDATTGQNALSQAKVFNEAVKLTGVVLAKLDSTAKGGVVIAIADRLKLPVRYVGLGEELEDLRPFDANEFVEALFSDTEDSQAASRSHAA